MECPGICFLHEHGRDNIFPDVPTGTRLRLLSISIFTIAGRHRHHDDRILSLFGRFLHTAPPGGLGTGSFAARGDAAAQSRLADRKTQYFRRAQMAYKCCCLQQDHRLDRLWADWQSLLRDELPTQLELVRKRKQRKQRDDRWEMAAQTPSTTTTEEDAVFHNNNEQRLLLGAATTGCAHHRGRGRMPVAHRALRPRGDGGNCARLLSAPADRPDGLLGPDPRAAAAVATASGPDHSAGSAIEV